MRGMYREDRSSGRNRKIAILMLMAFLVFSLLVYFSYLGFSARALGEDVYLSWRRLDNSLEAKAEAAALLSGYLVQSAGAERGMFDRMFAHWDDILLAEGVREKMLAGRRANSESYGVIALARAGAGGMNDRARRILERLDSLELRLAADIEAYNGSVARLRSKAEEVYLGELLIAFSGCGDFEAFAAGRPAGD
jgi:hypothetical protein